MQISVDSALAFLENRGFVNKKQNLRLLKKANYNPELVANFLTAKQALQSATNPDVKSSGNSNKPFGIRRKLAKQAHPELFAKFIEAKKALHKSSNIRDHVDESEEERQLDIKEEEEPLRRSSNVISRNIDSVTSPSPATVALDVQEEQQQQVESEPIKRRGLTKEERIARKLQRIQLKAAKNNQDVNIKTEDTPFTSEQQQEEEEEVIVPKRGRLSKEERLARKESRLKMKLIKLSQKDNNNNSNSTEDSSVPQQQQKRCGKLTKEERLARKEERLKLKEARLILKEQRLTKREGLHIPQRVTSVFIDGSSFSKTQDEIAEMAKNILEKNPQLVKVTILYEGVEVTSLSSGKMVIASATPLFDSVEETVKILTSKIEDKKTFTVISANKTWIQALRNEGVNAFAPVF